MNKKEYYYTELGKIIKNCFEADNEQLLVEYFIENSNLPGRRANLELANAFADISAEFKEDFSKKLWNICLFLICFTPDKAPTNNPKEFLAFCGTWAIGAIGASNPEYYYESLRTLKKLSDDKRWREREAVAFGLQKLLIIYPEKTILELKKWIDEDNWLTIRAIAAGIAHPTVLINKKISKIALEIHELIFFKIISNSDLSSEEFRSLKKGLSYTLSVVVQAIPDEGFKFLNRYIKSDNSHIQIIIRENLKKNRLTQNFPKDVALINKKMKLKE